MIRQNSTGKTDRHAGECTPRRREISLQAMCSVQNPALLNRFLVFTDGAVIQPVD